MNSSSNWLTYFKAKAWALLHDPPNKMWVIMGRGKCFSEQYLRSGAHEEEAAAFWYKLGLADPFGDMHDVNDPVYKLVKNADAVSASMDRWLLESIMGATSENEVFKYARLHNIFNPTLVEDLPDYIDCSKVNAYSSFFHFNGNKGVLDYLDTITDVNEKARAKYHVFYALYELAWINNGLPPSLADTRIPTHTVFDHDYATALTVNMLWPNGDISGYLVEVDIPGIQRIVNAARKTGDFWAGSWLISILAWLTVWPLVWEYGPDVVIKPTLRLNPVYHVTLINALKRRKVDIKVIEGMLSSFYTGTIFNLKSEVPDLSLLLIKEPIIPGTITMILPRDAAKDVNELRSRIITNFNNAYTCLVEWAFTGKVKDDYCMDVLYSEQGEVNDGNNVFLKIARKLYSEFKDSGIFSNLISTRVNAINLNEVYQCLISNANQCKVTQGNMGINLTDEDLEISKHVKGIASLRKLLSGRGIKINNEELVKFTIIHMGLRILHKVSQESARRSLMIGKTWFKHNGSTLSKPMINNTDPYSKYVYYRGGNVGFTYCSMCGDEPAIIHLRKTPGGIDYSNNTKEMLKEEFECSGDNKCINELIKLIKPGEALGPLCLLKRALYYRFRNWVNASIFDTTEDIAFAWYVNNIRINKNDLQQDCGRTYEYIIRDAKSITDLCSKPEDCDSETARRVFNECMNKINTLNEVVSKAAESLANDLSTDYTLKNYVVKGITRSIIEYRSNYAVIRGDADNIGKLSRGEVPMVNYEELFNNLSKSSTSNSELVKAYNKLRELVHEIGGLITSPTYLASLSMALVVTSLKDIYVTNYKYYIKAGQGLVKPYVSLIFSAGDDVLALAPVELALSFVRDMRKNYWGDENGFHRINNYYIAAPATEHFGKSFSVRFVNIMDNMNEEIKAAFNELEETSKKSQWKISNVELKKDSLTISESRTGVKAVLPLSSGGLSNVATVANTLNWLLIARLGGVLSANVPEDFEDYSEAVSELIKNGKYDMLSDVWRMVISRNVKVPGSEDALKIVDLFSVSRLGKEIGVELTTELLKLEDSDEPSYLINELVKAYRILRGYP
ncbi:MAG: type III-B CRISPR-associated protein Cas10/Cmr2 [Caldivirga sp.]|uniref:type III-B CRISPR-associated protein Cas10/Cmr2 n=1 Tax=Caldivirga sp. TaxID=2080243 RepID=UPI003D0BE8A6